MANWINSKGNVEMLERLDLVKEQLASELAPAVTAEVTSLEDRILAKITELSGDLSSYQDYNSCIRRLDKEAVKLIENQLKGHITEVEAALAAVDFRAERAQKLAYQRLSNKVKSLKIANELSETKLQMELNKQKTEVISEIAYLHSRCDELKAANDLFNQQLDNMKNDLKQAKKHVKIALGSLAALVLLIAIIGAYHG